jgi:hypothetical protein
MAVAWSLAAAVAWASPAPEGESDRARFRVEVEGGAVWQTRNDVRIPGDTGTEFSLVDAVGEGPWPAGRVYMGYALSARSELLLLLGPLTIEETGTLPETVDFAGETYASGVPTETKYRFNSYRLTWLRTVHDGDRALYRLGLTVKIRDAEIALVQGATSSSKSNVGGVPLIHAQAVWRLGGRTLVDLDADGLAAPQGRAFDVALKLRQELGGGWDASIGYRTLEGGADNDEVHTWSWFHYAVASVTWRR